MMNKRRLILGTALLAMVGAAAAFVIPTDDRTPSVRLSGGSPAAEDRRFLPGAALPPEKAAILRQYETDYLASPEQGRPGMRVPPRGALFSDVKPGIFEGGEDPIVIREFQPVNGFQRVETNGDLIQVYAVRSRADGRPALLIVRFAGKSGSVAERQVYDLPGEGSWRVVSVDGASVAVESPDRSARFDLATRTLHG